MSDAGVLVPKKKGKRKRKRKRNRSDAKNDTDVEQEITKPVTQRKRSRKRKRKNGNEEDDAIHYEKLKSFNVVPQHSFAIKHFAIDTKSLFDVVKNLT